MFSADAEMMDFFGYVKTVKTISIVMIVCMCIAFPSLIFIWYPIIGLNVSRKWNESSFGCVLILYFGFNVSSIASVGLSWFLL